MMLDPESLVEVVRLEHDLRLRKHIPLDLDTPPRPSLLARVSEYWARLWQGSQAECVACCVSCETAH